MFRIAVFASGSGSNFENLVLSSIQSSAMPKVKVACLICDQPNAFVLNRAKRLQVPFFVLRLSDYLSKDDYEQAIIQILRAHFVECIALAGYMKIVGRTLLSAYANQIVNIHPSYLPAFKGAHAIKDAYVSGALESGVTIHWVSEAVDEGAIILQQKITFPAKQTLAFWERAIHELEHRLYPQAINHINPYL